MKQHSFNYPYHFHPELELTLILKGSGKRFVGDNINDFHAGDLVLIGKNLPHCWLDYGKNSGDVRAVVIQFSEECFGKDFFQLPELSRVADLLKKSSKGISFVRAKPAILEKIAALPGYSGAQKILSLIDVFHDLSITTPQKALSKIDYTFRSETSRFGRINIVYDFVYQNFKEEITLADIADRVHMNVSAFCHYFKKSTGKTFSEFVNEIRIGFACKLLIETDLTVGEICFQSGYNGLSNFNKVFRNITNLSPLSYRKEFRSAT